MEQVTINCPYCHGLIGIEASAFDEANTVWGYWMSRGGSEQREPLINAVVRAYGSMPLPEFKRQLKDGSLPKTREVSKGRLEAAKKYFLR